MLLVLAYHAITTQNMISVIAVLAFNVSLVISGALEVIERHKLGVFMKKIDWAWGFKTSFINQQITTILWIIPAVDLAFHLGCDWSAWLVRSDAAFLQTSC